MVWRNVAKIIAEKSRRAGSPHAPRWPCSPLASTPTSPYPLLVLVTCLSSTNARPRCREPAPTSCSSSPATSVLRSMEQRPKHSRLPGRPVRGAHLLHRSAPKSCAREPGVVSAANDLWREQRLPRSWSVHIHTYALFANGNTL